MKKITGTIIDPGNHVDAGGTVPEVSIAANVEELLEWDGPLFEERVVIVNKTDYDAREEWIAQLCEQMGRLRDANLQRVAECMSRWCKPQ